MTVYWYMEAIFLQGEFFRDFEEEGRRRGWMLPIMGDYRQKPDKYMRILATTPYYERGVITYNEKGMNSPDFKIGLQQLLAFQKGSSVHDDAPDADEGAFEKMQKLGVAGDYQPIIGERPQKNHW